MLSGTTKACLLRRLLCSSLHRVQGRPSGGSSSSKAYYGSVQDFKSVFGGGSSSKGGSQKNAPVDPLALPPSLSRKIPAFAATSGAKLPPHSAAAAAERTAGATAAANLAAKKAAEAAAAAAVSAPTSVATAAAAGVSDSKLILEIRAGGSGAPEVLVPAIAELKQQIAALSEQLRLTQQLLSKHLNIPLPAAAAAAAVVGANKPAAGATATKPVEKPVGPDLRKQFAEKQSQAPIVVKEWNAKFDPDGCHPDIALLNDNTTAKCAVDGDDPEGSSNMLCYIGNPPEGVTELKFRLDRLGIGMIYLCPSDTPLNPDNLTPLDHTRSAEGSVPGKLPFEGVTLAFIRSGDINIHTPNGDASYPIGIEAGHIITTVCTVDKKAGTTQITFKVGKKSRIPRSLGPYTVRATDLSLAVGFGWKGTALTLVP